ncbi:MAG: hypothetical protein QXX70_00245 [Candidatus Micrarchaeaceae archaeon]
MLVISLSGSVMANGSVPNASFLSKFARLIRSIDEKIVIIAGGGTLAKSYIETMRSVHNNEYLLDMLGIKATELNAYALLLALKSAGVSAGIAKSIEQIPAVLSAFHVAVSYGQMPGITTDTDAALACEITGSKLLVNISKDAYVYDKPPELQGAKRQKQLSHKMLAELAQRYDTRQAKSKFIFDIVACKIAWRSEIEIRFVNDSIENIEKAIKGKRYDGTIVKG